MNKLWFLLLLVECTVSKPPVPIPGPPIVIDTIHKTVTITDTVKTIITTVLNDTITDPHDGSIYVDAFGAVGQGGDDIGVFEKAAYYVIDHPEVATTLKVHSGKNYYWSRPLLLREIVNGNWKQVSINIVGDKQCVLVPSNETANIFCQFNHGFAIGIQKGKNCLIKNLAFYGQYTFPNTINIYNVATTKYAAWNDGSVEDSRYAVYSGICIDPFCDSNAIAYNSGTRYRGYECEYLPNTGRGASSGIYIEGCAIRNFAVGVVISPNGYTQNGEVINISNNEIEACKDLVDVCQDQSKSITIEHLVCWQAAHTGLGSNYGAGSGGGSVYCMDWNLAGAMTELVNASVARFPLSFVHIYSESLFRVGAAYGAQCNFIDCAIDLLDMPNIPAPDYVFVGSGFTWTGGSLRYYNGDLFSRLFFATNGFIRFPFQFRDCTLSNCPIITELYGIPINKYYPPLFDHVQNFYAGALSANNDTAFYYDALTRSNVRHIDRSMWTGYVYVSGLGNVVKVGDYLTSEAYGVGFYDNPSYCSTLQIGKVERISNDTAYIDKIGLNVSDTIQWNRVFVNRLK
jgi:hypothetical protein